MAVIVCENLKYLYSVGTPFESTAIENVSLEIEKEQIIGIIGHTGSGKSTLIQHFNGLLEPHDGKVFLNGNDIWQDKSKIRSVRFAVGLCFQYPEYQIFEENVFKEIAFGPKQMGLGDEEISKRVYESAEFVGISKDLMNKSPFDLSGGQKRRVAIASIISMRPEVLILDEPCAGLDPAGRNMILSLIRSYQRSVKSTVVLVSHSMEDIAEIADKVIVMNKGNVAYNAGVNEVYSHAAELKKMGLSVPQVTEIFLKLKENGVDCKTDIYNMNDAVDEVVRLLQTERL